MPNQPSIFGRQLQFFRKARRMTKEQLRQASGVKRETISMIESGHQQSTSINNLVALANALNVTVDQLVKRVT